MGSYQAGLGAFTTLIQVSVILTGTVLIAKGSVDVSDLVTFMLYISVFTDPVRTLIDFTEQFQNGYTGFERFQEILAIHPDIEDKKDAVELKDVKGDITFENVSFQFKCSGGGLHGISRFLRRRKKYALFPHSTFL